MKYILGTLATLATSLVVADLVRDRLGITIYLPASKKEKKVVILRKKEF